MKLSVCKVCYDIIDIDGFEDEIHEYRRLSSSIIFLGTRVLIDGAERTGFLDMTFNLSKTVDREEFPNAVCLELSLRSCP